MKLLTRWRKGQGVPNNTSIGQLMQHRGENIVQISAKRPARKPVIHKIPVKKGA